VKEMANYAISFGILINDNLCNVWLWGQFMGISITEMLCGFSDVYWFSFRHYASKECHSIGV